MTRSRAGCAKVEDLTGQHSCLAGVMGEGLVERSIDRGLEADQTAHCRSLAHRKMVADPLELCPRLASCWRLVLLRCYQQVWSY